MGSGFAHDVKRCCRCREERSLCDFATRSDSGGLAAWCRDCVRAYARERQAARRADPQESARVKEEKKRHAATPAAREKKRRSSAIDNHRRRQRHTTAPFRWSVEEWDACRAAWAEACAYCGVSGIRLVQDHFIPISSPRFPGTIPGNMLPACARCNGLKGERDPMEWCRDHAALPQILRYLEAVATAGRGGAR